jgi:hypothetical protein
MDPAGVEPATPRSQAGDGTNLSLPGDYLPIPNLGGGHPRTAARQDSDMPQFQGLPRAVLVAISNASGETYREIDGNELMAELAHRGQPEPEALSKLLLACGTMVSSGLRR